MRRAALLAALLCAAAPACKKPRPAALGDPAPNGLSMTLTLSPDGRSLGVEIRLNAPEAAEVRALRATRGWAGTRPLAVTEAIEVRDARGPIDVGAPVAEGAFSVLPLARPPSGSELAIRYTARSGIDLSRLSLHRAAAGLSAVGHAFVVRPAMPAELPFTLRFRADPSSGATLATTLDGRTSATVEDLATAVYVAGPSRSEVLPSGDRATVAFGAAMDPRAALDIAAKTTSFAERAFGQIPGEQRSPLILFLIGERGIDQDHDGASTGGALSLWIDTRRTLDASIRILLAHETLHRVFGGALRLDAAGGDAAWFSEGFTTHYARRALFDQALIPAEAFLADVARTHEAASETADDGGTHEIGYGLGSRYAALLDAEIRSHSAGKRTLDDLVRALFALAGKSPGAPIPMPDYRKAVAAEIGEDRERALWDSLVVGALPDLPDDAFGPCFHRKHETRTVADLGFDPASLDASPQIVRGTTPGSAAGRAGVRDGALILRTSLRASRRIDPDVEIELVLAGKKGKQVVRYKPARTEKVAVWAAQACKR